MIGFLHTFFLKKSMRGIACFAGERGLCPLYVVQRRPRRHSDKFFDPLFFNAAALNDNLIRDAHPFRGKVGACEVCRTIVVPCGHAPWILTYEGVMRRLRRRITPDTTGGRVGNLLWCDHHWTVKGASGPFRWLHQLSPGKRKMQQT